MATVYTFARLTPPRQFRPEEDVIFKLEYSEDLVALPATLIIDGYSDYWEGSPEVPAYDYHEYRQVQIPHTSLGNTWDVGYEEYLVPGGSLGKTPPPEQPMAYWTGTVRARVEFDLGEGKTFTSNTVVVNMILMWDDDLKFLHTPYVATTSTFSPMLYYTARHSFGEYDSMYVNSYRFYLYDSHYNLIEDSGEMYDWNSYTLANSWFKFKGLKDNHIYYVRAKVTLNGGYVFWRGYERITVHYSELPEGSPEFTTNNSSTGINLILDLTNIPHDRILITRSVVSEDIWLEIKDIQTSEDKFITQDHYAIPNVPYIYRAIVYNGNGIAGTYYCYSTFSSNWVTISDIYGSYSAVGSIEKYPISRNDRGQEYEAMNNVYPYYIINGDTNFDRGSVNALFAETKDDCSVDLENHEYANILRAWLNNGRAKLLTYYTGEAWIVATSGIQTTDPDNTDTLNTSFNWVQIGDAFDINSYPSHGLVVNDDG